MQIAKVTTKGQVTIPVMIRDRAELQTGDLLSFEVEDSRIISRKIRPQSDDYLRAVPATLDEWLSDEDEAAWHDL